MGFELDLLANADWKEGEGTRDTVPPTPNNLGEARRMPQSVVSNEIKEDQDGHPVSTLSLPEVVQCDQCHFRHCHWADSRSSVPFRSCKPATFSKKGRRKIV